MRPKNTTKLLSVLFATAIVASAQANPLAGTLRKVANTGVFVIGNRNASIPFSYLDPSMQPRGFAIDLCQQIANSVKAKIKRPDMVVQFVSVTPETRTPLLLSGAVDIECGSTTNSSERAKQVAFGINHYYTGTRVLIKKASNIKDYADLKGKTVAISAGTSNIAPIKSYLQTHRIDASIMLTRDHAEGVALVESGQADAYATGDILLYGLLANAKRPQEWEIVGTPLQEEPFAVMLRKNDPDFKKLVDDTLAHAMQSGDFEKLYNKWFMSPIPPKGFNLDSPVEGEVDTTGSFGRKSWRLIDLKVPMSAKMKTLIRNPTDKPEL
jgi:ABC-type amino acid transport substrate-binding protein